MSDNPNQPPTYVDKKTVNASYRPHSSQMSPGLKRARQPFLLRNVLTGLVLASFTVGVWAYSIGAVKQEDFTDIDEEAKALRQSAKTESTQKTVGAQAVVASGSETETVSRVVSATDADGVVVSGRPRGLVASLLWDRYPSLLDPRTRTLVWGAPPVDRIGRIGDRPPP
ncbi:hypothetical protein BC835DRAFT_1266066 [Cytidiella melzeri]|nr:hypothetical protein BC835DRAFT_1266066 [Cytidiella melzeri]